MTTVRAGLVLVVAVAAACTRQPGETSRPAPVPAGPRLYVTNERSGDLTVIDIATRQPIATVPLGKRPRGIRATVDGKTLYIALSGSPFAPPGVDEKTLPPPDRSADGIGVFDTTTMKLVRVIAAGTDPEQLSLSKDGRRLYVANEDAATASVVEIDSGTIITVVKVGVEPEGVETSPDGRTVYVTSEENSEVFVIDTSTGAVTTQFKTSARPRSTGFLPDGSRAYVTCENGNAVDVVDARTHRVTKTIKMPSDSLRPMGIAVAPDGGHVYVTTGRGRQVVDIDTRTDEIVGSFDVGDRPWGIAISPDGRTLYTANGPSNDVSIIDVGSPTVARVKAGEGPWGVVFTQ
jgi:YVTN family beta-propeller protein